MRAAFADARMTPDQIDYLNTHGTSTPMGDEIELRAIERLFGAASSKLSVSSTKSAIGHLLGGAGSVESVICLMALEGQWLPANLNVRELDPVCTFDLLRAPRDTNVRTVLTNSFGFGGANATLIFQKEGGR